MGLYWQLQPGQTLLAANAQSTIAAILLVAALAYRAWQVLAPVASVPVVVAGNTIRSDTRVPGLLPSWLLYGFAWNLEVAVALVLSLTDSALLYLAIANIALGFSTQLLGDWWQRRRPADAPPMPSVHVIPLIYAGLGSFFRWGQFTNWTGLTTLGLSLIAIGVGKRRLALKPLVYLGMAGISLGLYECLLFQLLQIKGNNTGDGFIAMAALAATFTYAYRFLSPWLQHYLSITEDEVNNAAHGHWGLGSLLLAVATTTPVSLYPLWFGVALLLVRYAFFQGRHAPQPRVGELWVWAAIAEAVGMAWYGVNTPLGRVLYPAIAPFLSAIACVFAYFSYQAPWAAWGWHPRPLLLMAIVLPLLTIPPALSSLYPPNILIPAAFYLFLAYQQRQIRFTYISLGVVILWLWRWLAVQGNHDSLWYSLAIGLVLLYVAQAEPILKPAYQRGSRFLLRLVGCLAICAIPLLRQTAIGLIPAGLGLVAIMAGLALRVRAYLLVGAATFLLTVLYQLGVLVFEYPLTKWILGLLAGIGLLYISATFETRRDQMLSLMRQWLTELNNWD
ncbi:MAG: hypothetical protein NZ772_15150 [Cyanobacteria bacterium]|nr:hypothetical protein [Cyanobacteriota bacterium]MDW8202653.1 hypothetical protein [Cyanobacteriota bacterium SKYGB_h_bin112]